MYKLLDASRILIAIDSLNSGSRTSVLKYIIAVEYGPDAAVSISSDSLGEYLPGDGAGPANSCSYATADDGVTVGVGVLVGVIEIVGVGVVVGVMEIVGVTLIVGVGVCVLV